MRQKSRRDDLRDDLFVCFGRPEVPHAPKFSRSPESVKRVDVPATIESGVDAAGLLDAAAAAVEKLWLACKEHGVQGWQRHEVQGSRATWPSADWTSTAEFLDVEIGGPEDPALAVAFLEVLRGFHGQDLGIIFPIPPQAAPPEFIYDLNQYVQTGELALDSVGLRADLRGSPHRDKTYDAAFVCFDTPAVPAVGVDTVRVDLPIDIRPTGDPAAPGDHPFGWSLLARSAAYKSGNDLRKTYDASKVIIGLPEHAGLAVTIAALYRKFWYDEGPQFAWVTQGASGPVYDLHNTFSATDAVFRGERLRKALVAER